MHDELIEKLSRKAKWLYGTPALDEASDLMYQSIEEIQKWKSIADDLYEYFVLGIGHSSCVTNYTKAIELKSNKKEYF